ncbi:MAG: hydroxyethylthiazole kinase [Clostridia bacterium]|nr:hydroxyethylthiazole kinase [Clostridia bacterium]
MEELLDRAGELLEKIRKERPLVHNITNIVAANSCANILLSVGALPVMTYDKREIGDIVAKSQAVVLNSGTLTPRKLDAMIYAGKAANRESVPVVLDPVGAGSSTARSKAIQRMLRQVDISVIRGNFSEISFLGGGSSLIRGVEAVGKPLDPLELIKDISIKFSTTVCISGETDYISCGKNTYVISNGHPLMARVTGTGCMLSTLVGAFTSVTYDYDIAAAAAALLFGISGQLAGEKARGPGSFQAELFDTIYSLTPRDIVEKARLRKES